MNQYTITGTLLIVALLAACNATPTSLVESSISSDQLEKRRVVLLYENGADEPFTGQIIERYGNGQTKQLLNVVNGRPGGAMTEWYESGQKKREADLDSNKTGRVTEWYESGQMKADGRLYSGRPDGVMTSWYENGQIEIQETFVKGRSQEKITWDENGTSSTTIRAEIEEVMNISMGAKAAVTEYYMDRGEFPGDNAIAGLTDGSKITGKYVTSVVIDAGLIKVSLGRDSDAAFAGHVMIFSPTPVQGSITWQCSSPDIAKALLPEMCR